VRHEGQQGRRDSAGIGAQSRQLVTLIRAWKLADIPTLTGMVEDQFAWIEVTIRTGNEGTARIRWAQQHDENAPGANTNAPTRAPDCRIIFPMMIPATLVMRGIRAATC